MVARLVTRARFLLVLALLVLGGCAQATPRFPQDVQTSLATGDMRRLETPDMNLYYPAREREEALRVASRLEGCLQALRARSRIDNRASREKKNIVLADLPLNNAYVGPAVLGLEHVGVIATHSTIDLFGLLGIPPDPATIGCHEMVHYVQARQMAGIPKTAEAVFGYLLSPEIGLDSWFWEGIAVYYETRLQGGVGRLGSAFHRGVFEAYASAHDLREADLSELTRRVPFTGAYLTGSHFVDWLVEKYGEGRLWDVIERQADEVAFFLGVSGRFFRAYGKTLAGLYADFAAETKASLPTRALPSGQRKLRTLDMHARYVVAPDGTEAWIHQGVDTPLRLVVASPDGATLVERNLVDVLPFRDLVAPTIYDVSGLSFTADSKTLAFVVVDRGKTFNESRLARFDLPSRSFEIVATDIHGAGGAIAPDGSRYVFARPRGDRWQVAAYDFATESVRVVADYGARAYAAGPRLSPDGTKIALTFQSAAASEANTSVLVVDAKAGAVLVRYPNGSSDPSWLDDDHLLYTAVHEGRLQVFRATLSSSAVERISDAPHLAFSPFARGGKVRFLSREGNHWTIDEVDGAPVGPSTGPLPESEAQRASAPPASPPVQVIADEPYASDRLFVPTLRGPSAISIARLTTILGMGISGGDRLGFHRWALDAAFDTVGVEASAGVKYVNTQLAPVFVQLQAARTAYLDEISVFDPTGGEEKRRYIRKELVANLAASRTFWTTTVQSGFRYDQLDDSILAFGAADPRTRRAAGPFAVIAYDARETTPAAGVRRALVVTASGAGFPALSAPAFGDTRLAVRVTTPLPLSVRHTFTVEGRGRALPGLPEDLRFLEVGGAAQSVLTGATSASDRLPPTVAFVEPLRGFEDLGLPARRVAIGEGTYRYPIIIDTGSISTINVLPPVYLRQIDFEAFGTIASLFDDRRELATAAGGAVIFKVAFWRVPFGLGLQVARRLTMDEGTAVSFAGGVAQ